MNWLRPSLILCGAVLTGCFTGGPSSGFDGEWSPGDQGYGRFQIHDGLCPGLSGGCNLDTILATGSTPEINIDVPDADIDGLTAAVDGPLAITMQETDGHEIFLDASASSAGTATLMVTRSGGDHADTAAIQIADPVGLRCGLAPVESVRYDGTGMTETDTVTLAAPTASETGLRQLICRITDAEDRALLAVGVVSWQVTSGEDFFGIQASALGLGTDHALAARVYVTPFAAGSGTLVATMGAEERTFTVTVTE